MRGLSITRAGAVLTLVAVLAVLGAGALRPAGLPLDPGLAAFVAAGGSLEDICGTGHGGHPAGGPHCDACRLLGPVLLPDGPRPGARSAAPIAVPAAAVALAPVRAMRPAGEPRAPPRAC
jgi:hypothetical protein